MTDITEYTPGPWWVQEVPTSISVHAADGGVAKMTITPRSARAAEGRANARLIAAAPDLLNAILKSDDAHWTPAMRAAIKKATKRTLAAAGRRSKAANGEELSVGSAGTTIINDGRPT